MMNNPIAESFELGFLSQPLSKQIAHCDNDPLAPLFLQLFFERQPVLEAGCGSGRWCGWFHKHSIQSNGIDWSKELCNRASREMSHSKFIACDIQNTPFPDCSYAGIIALGTIEHTVEGPQKALKEFFRLLNIDGVAVITVPYGGWLRILIHYLGKPRLFLKTCVFIRRLFGKSIGEKTLRQARQKTNKKWHPTFGYGHEGCFFYEYQFNKNQMRAFFKEAGFEIHEEFVEYGNSGMFHNFGKLVGKWNKTRGDVDFTILGRILRKVFPVSVMGHMICYVIAKRSFNKSASVE